MRHALCVSFCWMVMPCLAQQNSADLNSSEGPVYGATQKAAGSAASDNALSAPTLDDTQAGGQGEQSGFKRSARPRAAGDQAPAIPNPFDLPSHAGMSGMEAMDEGVMEMEEDMMGDMGGGSMGMGMDMGMGGMEDYDGDYGEMYGGEMYGGGMGSVSSVDRRFQTGLQRAIAAIRKSESEEDRKTLLNFVRRAFEDRYDESIQSRQKQLLQIKQRVAKLESELKRREAAKSRVVEVQLQSVQLAAEGLLELDGQ